MKKVLLASTALVVTSSAAMAEVGLSGYAEMGIVGGGGAMETQFHHDLDVKFSLSGESDNGLSFGATIDLDEVGDDCTITTGTTHCSGGDPISSCLLYTSPSPRDLNPNLVFRHLREK